MKISILGACFIFFVATTSLFGAAIVPPITVSGEGLKTYQVFPPPTSPTNEPNFWAMGSIVFGSTNPITVKLPITPTNSDIIYNTILILSNETQNDWKNFSLSLEGSAKFSFELPPNQLSSVDPDPDYSDNTILSFHDFDWPNKGVGNIAAFNLVVPDSIDLNHVILHLTPTAIPEPATLSLIAISGLLLFRRK